MAKVKSISKKSKEKKKMPTLDNLEIAFQYNPALRDTIRKELHQQENDWAFLQDNWYLNEVLIKKATKQ